MSDKVKAYIGLTSTAMFWGASFVSIKICMEVFGPLYLAFYRYIFTSLIIFFVLKLMKKLEKIDRKDIFRMAASGITGVTMYFAFENNAVLKISSNEASILIGTIPIFSLIFNRFIYKSRITLRNFLSIAASIFGIYLIIGGASFSLNVVGYIFMILAAVSWSMYQFLVKPLFEKYSHMTITMYQSLFGVLGFVPFLRLDYMNMDQMGPEIMAHFIFLTLICSALCTYLYLYSQEILGINIASVFLNLIPVFTFVFSFIILNEKLSLIQTVGALIVIVAVSCVKEEIADSARKHEEPGEINAAKGCLVE